MNYQNYANYDNIPPFYGSKNEAFYDFGNGIPKINQNNMTVQDIYRTPFLFIQEHHKNYNNMQADALKGIQSESELSKLFFSDTNMKRLQKKIKQEVFKRTNGKFRLDTDQEQQDLFIVMRAIYMEHARFLPNNTVRQVKRLNEKVITETIFSVITNIKQYYGYLKEINKPLDPIPRPLNLNKGRKILPSISTIYHF